MKFLVFCRHIPTFHDPSQRNIEYKPIECMGREGERFHACEKGGVTKMRENEKKQREGGKASCLVTEAEGEKVKKGEKTRRRRRRRRRSGVELFSKCKELLVTMLHLLLPSLPLLSPFLRGRRRDVVSPFFRFMVLIVVMKVCF